MSDEWLFEQLAGLLRFPVPQEMLDYIKSIITNTLDLEDYMNALLDYNNNQRKLFLLDLLKTRKGRQEYDCQASRHQLVNRSNSFNWDRVVCEQECCRRSLFYNNLDRSREEAFLNMGANQSVQQMLHKQMDQKPSPVSPDYEASIQHWNRLLEYNQTSEKWSRLIDNGSDYSYSSTDSMWQPQTKKEVLKKKEEEMQTGKPQSQNDQIMNLVVLLRQMIEAKLQKDTDFLEMNGVLQEISCSLQSSAPNYYNEEIVDPFSEIHPKLNEDVKYQSQRGRRGSNHNLRLSLNKDRSTEEAFLNMGANQSVQQMLQKQMDQKPSPFSPDYEASIQQWNRLLGYNQTSEKQTREIDDESNNISPNSKWLSQPEREKPKKKEEEMQARKNQSQKDQTMTLDIELGKVKEAKPQDNINSLEINEVQQEIHDSEQSSDNDETAKSSSVSKPEVHLGLVDEGWCLSVRQPKASLIVLGIEWYYHHISFTGHTGFGCRLWIASANETPTDFEIKSEENRSKERKKFVGVEYPLEYPYGCLLGCVFLRESRNKSLCTFLDAVELRAPIPMTSRNDNEIHKLDPELHQRALKEIEEIMVEKDFMSESWEDRMCRYISALPSIKRELSDDSMQN